MALELAGKFPALFNDVRMAGSPACPCLLPCDSTPGGSAAGHQLQALRAPGQTFCRAELVHFGAVLEPSSRAACSLSAHRFCPHSLAVLALLAMGAELLTLMSFLPPPQESSTVQQLSIDLLLETRNFVEDQERTTTDKEARRNLVLFYLHLHDDKGGSRVHFGEGKPAARCCLGFPLKIIIK